MLLLIITLATLISVISDKCSMEKYSLIINNLCDFLKNCSYADFFHYTQNLFHYALFIIPIYVFFQRVHSQNQHRALKSISDEIVKINDFVIEFILKFKYLKSCDDEPTTKDIYELEILKSKINVHLIYLSEFFNAFPYGGPLNYFLLVLTKKLFFPNARNLTQDYEFNYQSLILDDTVLSLELEFIENGKFKVLDENIIPLNQKTIDNISVESRNILEHLEKNTRKIF